MKSYQIIIENRQYSLWSLLDNHTKKPVDPELIPKINPFENKLFTNDIIQIKDETLEVSIEYSSVRKLKEIAGILLLDSNKTFGRTESQKKLLYKCIPDDKRFPVFLVPYDLKMGFSKVQKNKYIVFKVNEWKDKHPRGEVVKVLGEMENLDAFYEYQLYCKSLHISITNITNKTRNMLIKKSSDEYIQQIFTNPQFKIEDRRTAHRVITIDPQGSLDFDDGFSIKLDPSGNWVMSVYIANVYFWLETMGLWKSFSKRVSTIYLPDQRRPMLPTILSDSLCSLQNQQERFAFVMDTVISPKGTILDTRFSNALICVDKNYVYEDPKMLETDQDYKNIQMLSCMMDKSIKDSHDVVSYWMVLINKLCGEYMSTNKFGIFRSSSYLNRNKIENMDNTLNEDTQRMIKMWNNSYGSYVLYDDMENHEHEIMNIKSYVHISSPIRRIVDLLNQMLIFQKMNLVSTMTPDASQFLQEWILQMEYINTSMRSIRKVQTDCELVHRCFTDTTILNNTYTGVIFDKIIKSDDVYTYMVYLEEIKLLSRITCRNNVENYTKHPFKLYLFEDEEKVRHKIRLHMQTEI